MELWFICNWKFLGRPNWKFLVRSQRQACLNYAFLYVYEQVEQQKKTIRKL